MEEITETKSWLFGMSNKIDKSLTILIKKGREDIDRSSKWEKGQKYCAHLWPSAGDKG